MLDGQNVAARNPLRMVGKVFKYEFIAMARRLALVYALIPVAAIIVGLFFRNTFLELLLSRGQEALEFEENDGRMMVTGMILYFFVYIFLLAASIITLVVQYTRFKNGMFGKEAYLNFTLPVSVGEHLCARILSAVAWSLIYGAAMLISLLLFGLCSLDKILELIRNHGAEIPSWAEFQDIFVRNMGHSLSELVTTSLIAGLFGSILFVLFLYMICCVGHLARKRKILLQFVAVIVSVAVANAVTTSLFARYAFQAAESGSAPDMVAMLWSWIPVSIVFSAICGAVSYLILRFRLNLE